MKKKILFTIIFITLCWGFFNAKTIYNYSLEYSEQKSDVGIVLGAGTNNEELSPIFKERLNHAIYLYNKGCISKIILTGGIGENQILADSEIAKQYMLDTNIRKNDILIETKSRYTFENLQEAKTLMDSFKLKTALLISDPLHMKRSIELANQINLDCKSSPTRTSKYKSLFPKLKSLIYETVYFSLGKLTGNY